MREGEPTSENSQYTDEQAGKMAEQKELNDRIAAAYAANQQKLSGLGNEVSGTDYLSIGLETDNAPQ